MHSQDNFSLLISLIPIAWLQHHYRCLVHTQHFKPLWKKQKLKCSHYKCTQDIHLDCGIFCCQISRKSLPKPAERHKSTLSPDISTRKILITCFSRKKGPQLGCVLLCCCVQLCMRQLLGVIFLSPFLCFSWLFMPHSCSSLDDTAS